MAHTSTLRRGDRIIVPDNAGTVLISVTVLRVVPINRDESRIEYRRDAVDGGRRDYLFSGNDENWKSA